MNSVSMRPSEAESDEPMLVDCFAAHTSDFDADNVEVLQAYLVDDEEGDGEWEGDEDYVDDVEDEEEEAPFVAATAKQREKQPKKGHGGRHEDMRCWTPEEDSALMQIVAHFGTKWGKVVEQLVKEVGGDPRTRSMVRNRYMRILKGQQMKQEGRAKNRCSHCGELKSGHICKATAAVRKATVATVAMAAAKAEVRARAEATAAEARAQAEARIAAEAAAMVGAARAAKAAPARGVRGVRGVVGGLSDEERARIESLRARLVNK